MSNETLGDIVAELRADANAVMDDLHNDDCWTNVEAGEIYASLANRIEAAAKRERGALVAEAEAAKDARNKVAVRLREGYAKKCKECKSAPGNYAAMREALGDIRDYALQISDKTGEADVASDADSIADICDAALAAPPRNITRATRDWKSICAKCADGEIEPTFCAYYGEPNGCNSPTYHEHPLAAPQGDAAAIREALEELVYQKCLVTGSCGKPMNEPCTHTGCIWHQYRAALAAPPRNCDVGTAEEQARRFQLFCQNHRAFDANCSAKCPFDDAADINHCQSGWMQMPYEEGGAE